MSPKEFLSKYENVSYFQLLNELSEMNIDEVLELHYDFESFFMSLARGDLDDVELKKIKKMRILRKTILLDLMYRLIDYYESNKEVSK